MDLERKTHRRGIAAVCAILSAVTVLSACNSNSTASQPPGTTQSTNTESQAAAIDSGDKEPLGKYEKPLTIRFARSIDDDLQDNIIPKTPGETVNSNRWLKAYSEKLGIDVKYDWTVKIGDAYTQKINVTLASGDIPDMLQVNAAQMKQLAESDMIEDLTPYWDAYASDLLKEIYTAQGPMVLNATKIDGKMMGVGTAEIYGDGVFLWIRKDWLDKLKLPEPKTMKDVLTISEAFTTQDPDQNGKKDTYGLAITKDLYNGVMGLEGFFAGYHAYPNMWIDDGSGKLVWGSTLPEVKQGLQVLADMYKAGQIDKEFGVKDGGKVAETITAGKVGMEYGAQWNPMYPLISNYQNDPEANWVGYALVSNDGEPVLSPQNFGAADFWVVKKGFSNPEALIKMYNLHVELNWGKTGDFDYYYMPSANDSVGVWKYSPVTPYPSFKNLNAFRELQEARANGTLDKLTGEALSIQKNIEAFEKGDTTQWGWPKIYGADGVFRHSIDYVDQDRFKLEAYAGPPTKTMVEKKATLKSLEAEVFMKIIMGNVPIDGFDKFVADWNTLGGADMTKEVNEWYATVK